MALSGSLTTNAYGGVRSLTLTWSATQSVSGNTSTVNWTLSGSGSTANYNPWYMTGPTKVVIDGTQVHYSTSRIQLRSGTVVASGSRTISHNSDGAKSFTIRIEGAIYTTSVNCTAEQSFTLNQIPRGATITSAPNFKDTDSPKMEFSNPAGGTMQVGIYKTDGSTALAAYRTATGSSYTFTFTSTEKANLQKVSTTSNTATVRFYLKSVVGGQTFVKSVDRTLTIASPAPTLSPTVVDGNSTTVALTGDSSKLVKYHSDAKVTFGASAVKSATIKSKKVTCGSKSLTTDGTMQDVESGTFAFSVTDSRGNTTSKTVTKTLVNYVKLTCDMGSGVPDATGKFTFRVSGNFFNASFGAVANTLSVQYRYRVDGGVYSEYKAMTVSKSGNSYTATVTLTGLDYTKPHQFQAQAVDKLSTVTSQEKTVRATPVFDWSETDFNFNVPVKINGRTLFDWIYPVGSIYMSVNSVNPGTLFGGTWVAWGAGRVPVGINTGDADFKSVEKAGGSKNHHHEYLISYRPYYGALTGDDTTAIMAYDLANAGGWKVGKVDDGIPNATVSTNASLGKSKVQAQPSKISVTGTTSKDTHLPPYITCYMWKRTA